MNKPVGLSIAGIDTGNGAGSETDVKTFESRGVHGVLAPTAITAQNTMGIFGIIPVDPLFLSKEIEIIFQDFEVKITKIGMVYNSHQFKVIEDKVSSNIVVDPVIHAKDGTQLINDLDDYKRIILKKATVLTPNAIEASFLSRMNISSLEDALHACKKIRDEFGIEYVIVKGGHISSDYSFDVLCNGKEVVKAGYPRLNVKDTHGTGSVFSTVIAAEIAKGKSVENAFFEARRVLQDAILHGLNIGKGIGPIDPLVSLEKKSFKFSVIEEMIKFGDFIEGLQRFWTLIPEVQSNFAHSIPPQYVDGINDIATYRGRISKSWNNKVKVGFPAVFGNPTHTARMLLSIINFKENANSLINLRFDENILKIFKDIGYETIEINREKEPQHGEGKTMQWIIQYIKENYGRVPQIIFDRGMKGKEAMIRFWTSDIEEMMDSLKLVCNNI
ncbi:phosphomethylpyrimidine kinase [Candidatus Acidianus copahuensis]|uniref:Phosphomethylpyrimidine kinase n=1 Tax=Candidatus Acidianus copahuensis TaxID=1160895 RepID=A0A031LQZ8_9CREN|nr:bifunctional hydroxymethylpyrimidine kinase/phosphomethylpyrimidine kinase [Candidatus Acidianus copahuensis]EZQ10807.1 phosphomethylpyrimidine kinase [Candidatus Acidianus copahuensis]